MVTDAPATTKPENDDDANKNKDGADAQHHDDPAKDPKEDAGHPDNTPAENSWLKTLKEFSPSTWAVTEAAAAYFNTTDKDAASHGLASESLWSNPTGWVKNHVVDAISHFGFAEAVSLLPDKNETEIRALYNMSPTDAGDSQTATNLGSVERVYEGKDGSSATVKDGEVTHHGADGTDFSGGPGWMEAHNGTKGYGNDGQGGHQWEVGGLPGHNWKFEKNAKGDDVFTTADGDKAKIIKDADGHITKIEIDWHGGRHQEITDKEVLNRLDRGIRIHQHRHHRHRDQDGRDHDGEGDDKPGDGEDKPANTPTAAGEQPPAGDIDVRDHGVIKVTTQDQTEIFAHADGRKEIHLKTGERVLIRPDGSYQVFDKDNKAIAADASNGVTVKDDGTLQVAGATVSPTGVISTKEGVVIAADSNQTTVKNSQGRGTFTTVTATESGQSSVQTGACGADDQTDDDPDQPGACKLDPKGKPITDPALAPSVAVTAQSDVNADTGAIAIGTPGAMDHPQFWTDSNNPNIYHMDPGYGERAMTIDTEKNTEETPNGTIFGIDWTKLWDDTMITLDNMVAKFTDGLSLNGLTGDLLGLNGDKLDSGSFSTFDGDDLPVAAHASAVAASASGIAGIVGGLPPADITLGHVSQLLGAYSELSAIKGSLIAAGAFSAIAEVEQAQARVNAELGQAQIATVVQDISKQIGGPITNDALNNVFANSNGGDWQSIKISMLKMGIATPGAPELEQQPH